MINVDVMLAAGINPTAAKMHADHLAATCAQFGIRTMAQQACFLGQAAHETMGFTKFEENLYYSTPERIHAIFPERVPTIDDAQKLARNPQALANRVYSDRYGNGDEASNDGWDYRGRGAFHLTFRSNYEEAADALGRPYVDDPALVALPDDAALTAAWFFSSKGCLAPAGSWDIKAVTKIINPGLAGLNERIMLCNSFAEAMRHYLPKDQ